MNYLSLFTGAGGGDLAFQHLIGHRCVGYVEKEPYCQKIIAQRIRDGLLDEAPIFSDIRTLNRAGYAGRYRGVADIITGGFPCQPFSHAGKGLGERDGRNLWPETAQTVRSIKPRHVMFENVPGISKYLPTIIRDLRRTGYSVRQPKIVAAASVGAGHIRRRVWIYAYINEKRQQNATGKPAAKTECNQWATSCLDDRETIPPDTNGTRELQPKRIVENKRGWIGDCTLWEAEPDVVRVVYGLPRGMDRVAALGNAQVPVVAALAWTILTGGNHDRNTSEV